MVKAIPSQIVIKGFTNQWQAFKQRLPIKLWQDFEKLIEYARKHPHPDPEVNPFQQIVMAILIEQEKEINRLQIKLKPGLRKKCPRCHSEWNNDDSKGGLCPDCKEYLLFFLPKTDF
ncbi:hypothetical protein AYK24_08430 [Thermoplasmatales archaeon SG8-52-4]|jgi:hypothetical protein|nr:MAG: hypothetical protein AYK24_08430 [Thermoplasmatales archaeon SG8-52-4]